MIKENPCTGNCNGLGHVELSRTLVNEESRSGAKIGGSASANTIFAKGEVKADSGTSTSQNKTFLVRTHNPDDSCHK